jgi:hypothetical protein
MENLKKILVFIAIIVFIVSFISVINTNHVFAESTSDEPTTEDPSGDDTSSSSGDYGLGSVPSDVPQ